MLATQRETARWIEQKAKVLGTRHEYGTLLHFGAAARQRSVAQRFSWDSGASRMKRPATTLATPQRA
jgi:hypothetical protein